YLTALAPNHLQLPALYRVAVYPFPPVDYLSQELDHLASVSRFVRVVRDRSGDGDAPLRNALANELRNTRLDPVIKALDDTGVLDALDEGASIVFANLRRSVIPEEDIHFLRRAGVEDPEAEITIIMHYSREHLATSD